MVVLDRLHRPSGAVGRGPSSRPVARVVVTHQQPVGTTPVSCSRCRSVAPNASTVATSSMSPMCWLNQRCRPSATAQVFFRSAPTASVAGTSNGSATGIGCVAAGAADRHLAPLHHPGHRVVTRHVDPPGVRQPPVDERREPGPGLPVVGDDRFAAPVARRHHQYPRTRTIAGQPEQQHMQPGVRQHHAELVRVRRDRGSHAHRRIGPAPEQHDGTPRVGEHRLLVCVHLDDLAAQPPGRTP